MGSTSAPVWPRRVVSARKFRRGGVMFDRIVVGTDGSETATEAVRTAIELARLSNAKLEIVSAYEPVPQSRLKDEGEGISGDVAYAVNPREDVQFVLDKAASEAKKAKVEVVTHPR